MKKILTDLLASIAIICFALFALLSLSFHFGYLYYYEFYTMDSVVASIVWTALLIIISIFFVLLLRFVCKTKKLAVLVALIVVFAYLSVYSFFACAFGYNGCDYTEDIANYDRFGANVKYFPEEINDDFEVVDYSYYHTLCDTDHTEIYLEVRFDNREMMEEYLSSAIFALGSSSGVQEYQNPFCSTYTDVVADRGAMMRLGSGEAFSAYIDCDSYQKHRYVQANYDAISYSYEDLSIIYVHLDIGSDISIDHYYPKYLRRFDVEWNSDIEFYVKYEKIN